MLLNLNCDVSDPNSQIFRTGRDFRAGLAQFPHFTDSKSKSSPWEATMSKRKTPDDLFIIVLPEVSVVASDAWKSATDSLLTDLSIGW